MKKVTAKKNNDFFVWSDSKLIKLLSGVYVVRNPKNDECRYYHKDYPNDIIVHAYNQRYAISIIMAIKKRKEKD